MAARRYELTDAQWDRIKDMIPHAKTGRPPKDDRMMLNAISGWHEAERHGQTFRPGMARIRPCTADSASGVMTGLFCAFFRN